MSHTVIDHVKISPDKISGNGKYSHQIGLQYSTIDKFQWVPIDQIGYTNLKISGCYDFMNEITIQCGGVEFDKVHPKYQQYFTEQMKNGYFFDIMGQTNVVPRQFYHEIRINIMIDKQHNDENSYIIEFDIVKLCKNIHFSPQVYNYVRTKYYKYSPNNVEINGYISNIIILSNVKYDNLYLNDRELQYVHCVGNYHTYCKMFEPSYNKVENVKVHLSDKLNCDNVLSDDIHIFTQEHLFYATDGNLINHIRLYEYIDHEYMINSVQKIKWYDKDIIEKRYYDKKYYDTQTPVVEHDEVYSIVPKKRTLCERFYELFG